MDTGSNLNSDNGELPQAPAVERRSSPAFEYKPQYVSLDELTKLRAFKAYVHERLDQAGIPTHPDGPHSAAGCRIGDRLDIALANLTPIDVLAHGAPSAVNTSKIDIHQLAHEVAYDLREGETYLDRLALAIQGELLGMLQYVSVFGEPTVIARIGAAIGEMIALEKLVRSK